MQEEIRKKGGIVIDNITEGFAKYDYEMLEKTAEEYIELILGLLKLNGEENSYFDFYYNRLNEEEKRFFRISLSVEEKSVFEKMQLDDGIYYRLTEEIVPLLVGISFREVLFSSFYFCKEPCTIWGNYDKKFVMFKNRAVDKG